MENTTKMRKSKMTNLQKRTFYAASQLAIDLNSYLYSVRLKVFGIVLWPWLTKYRTIITKNAPYLFRNMRA